MALLNSGDSIEFWCPDEQQWVDLQEMRFEEAKSYRWRSTCPQPLHFRLNEMPMPMVKTDWGWEGEVFMPFQSGHVNFYIKQTEEHEIKSYLYTDGRKISEFEYNQMITDILEEANACFQQSGAYSHFQSYGVDRGISLPQWDYIQQTFYRLQIFFRSIESAPIRRLIAQESWIRREKIKHVTPALLTWTERHSGDGIREEMPIPKTIWMHLRTDTYDIYENRVIYRQLSEFRTLLRRYSTCSIEKIQQKANLLYERVSYWLKSSFLQEVGIHRGTIATSQVFRKHPMYRNWFNWFQQLYQFNKFKIGLKHSIPLKDTYHLYEIWVFMQLVKILREHKQLEDVSTLFAMEQTGLILNLSEKKEHRVKLKNGGTLAYQRWITSNTQPFMTYTHGMKPDIVLEVSGKLYLFDPKYRLDHNLPMALGEMHKYRDGIVKRESGERAVEEVYIVTPTPGLNNSHFFDESYRLKYNMGAYSLKPAVDGQILCDKILMIINTSI